MNDNYLWTIETENEQQTLEFGKVIGKHAKSGDTLCLTGDLGSGKTVVTRGIAQGLGVVEDVTSPTFTLLNIYQGKLPIYHFDIYRLENQNMVQDIGFYDYVGQDGVAVIEWADLIPDYLPDDYMRLDIKRDFETGSDHRVIHVYQRGDGMNEIKSGLDGWRKQNDHISG